MQCISFLTDWSENERVALCHKRDVKKNTKRVKLCCFLFGIVNIRLTVPNCKIKNEITLAVKNRGKLWLTMILAFIIISLVRGA